MKLHLKASEEKEDFKHLLGEWVTFSSDVLSIGGTITHKKGEKAYISDVIYNSGYWSRACSGVYVKPEICLFQINNVSGHWQPDTFEEFKKN